MVCHKQSVYLGGFGVVQVPKLDMPISCCDKIGAVTRKRHGCHFTRDFISSHKYIFLKGNKKIKHGIIPETV